MKPYYEHAGITIYHGDCREIIPWIQADALITDPPYGIGFNYGEQGHRDDPEIYGEFIWSVIEDAERQLLEDSNCAVFQSATTAHRWATWFPRDWKLLAIPKAFSQIRPTRPIQATDYVLYWTRDGSSMGEEDWHPRPGRDWFLSKETPKHGDRPAHPCPRPLDSMKYLVQLFVAPQNIVLDPFMGSGTTLVAAKQLGRNAIGIELEEKYCEIAARRLSQQVLDFSPKPKREPEQASILDRIATGAKP